MLLRAGGEREDQDCVCWPSPAVTGTRADEKWLRLLTELTIAGGWQALAPVLESSRPAAKWTLSRR